MDAPEYVRRQMTDAFRLLEAVMDGTSDEMLTWTPPGTANPIAATYAHTLMTIDFHIQRVCLSKPMLWGRYGWEQQLGVAEPPDTTWEQFKAIRFDLPAFREYAHDVYRVTESYLSAMQPDDLERTVNVLGRDRVIVDSLILAVRHTIIHAGEIAALKGIQGAKGLPY